MSIWITELASCGCVAEGYRQKCAEAENRHPQTRKTELLDGKCDNCVALDDNMNMNIDNLHEEAKLVQEVQSGNLGRWRSLHWQAAILPVEAIPRYHPKFRANGCCRQAKC